MRRVSVLVAAVVLSCARTVPHGGIPYAQLMAKAEALAAQCRTSEAVAVLWEAVRVAPQEIEPWLRIGELLSQGGRPREALAHWERILAVRPEEDRAIVGRWRALWALAHDVGSDSLRALVRREVEATAGRAPRSQAALERAVEGYRIMGNDSAVGAVGTTLWLRYPSSRVGFDVAMESYYDSLAPIWYDDAKKAQWLRTYLALYPESPMRAEAYATLASCLASLGKTSQLVQVLTTWVRECPEDPRALATAAYWYLEKDLGDFRALQYARRAVDAVATFPQPEAYPLARWELEMCSLRILAETCYARALLRRGDVETARRMALETVESPPARSRCDATLAPAYYTLAQCAMVSGALEEAARWLVKALEEGDVRGTWTSRSDSLLRLVLRRLGRNDTPLSYARGVTQYRGPVFTDVTDQVGLGGVRGARVAWADYDGDGREDLFVGGQRLFKNVGGRFEDVTRAVGLGAVQGSGGLLADVNNDGRADLLITGPGGREGDRLFLFDGETYHQVEHFPTDSFPTEGAAMADFDADGLLDIYLAKYERPGTLGQGTQDRLLMNRGEGFRDETEARGLLTPTPMAGRGVACADFDLDGDVDIFVSNYRLQPNFLWENTGGGVFVESGCVRGVRGTDHGGWFGHTIGSDWADFDLDGDLDLVSANLAHPRYIHFSDRTTLLRHEPEGHFVDVAELVGVPYEETSSDPLWADFDNDGDLDLYLTSVYEGRRSYLLLREGGRFRDVTYLAGVRTCNGWGCAAADYDGDGDLDLAVGSASGLKLFRNDTGGAFLKVRCVGNGVTTNRDCVGCRVVVRAGPSKILREVRVGKGTTSQNSLTQHVGLGHPYSHVDVEVRFTDGEVRRVPGVAPATTLVVFQ